MKRMTGLITCLALSALSLQAGVRDGNVEWQNEKVVERGKEKPHAWFLLPQRMELNGQWKFRFDKDVEEAPADFHSPTLDDSRWGFIRVPSNWEMEGHGHPVFINFKYNWTPNPPYIDIPNPTGSYRTHFTLPETWQGQHVMLHFGSIAGYARIFVNGKDVGMTKASKTPAEFDITPHLRPGSNLLAVQVLKYHDGSYMEDQDFWRMAGIEREVYLQAYKPLSVWDYAVKAQPVKGYRDGQLEVDVQLRKFGEAATASTPLEMRLVDAAQGRAVYSETRQVSEKDCDGPVHFATLLKKVRLWSAETPNLYEMQLIMNGDTVRQNVGFREIKIENARLLVNGKPVYVKGVNRHETNDSLGHVPTVDIMMHDARMMKQLNINAVRCCHYPDDPRWLDICDKYGFYVIDEANIETHGMGSVPYFNDTIHHPAYLPSWIPAHEDRISRMYYRDRNHPSIVGWSLGNECGNGQVFKEQYRWLKKQDPSRFVQFEQAWEDWNTDVVALMYPNWGRMKDYAKSGKTRPFIMCEYAHAQGNGNGNLQELWDLIKSAPNMQGGFIWDWQDQGLLRQRNENDDHRTYHMYNGGMGSHVWPDDENSGTDGILASDGTPKPQASEVKKVYQDIHFTGMDWKEKTLWVRNEFFFTTLAGYDFRYTLHRMGQPVAEGDFRLKTAPQDSTKVKLDLPELKDSAEYTLEVFALQGTQTELLPKGHEVARGQFVTGNWQAEAKAAETAGATAYAIHIDKRQGTLNVADQKGKKMFAEVPEPYFWRPPTDNDFGNGMPRKMGLWRQLQTNRQVVRCTEQDTQEGHAYCFEMKLKDIEQPYSMTYVVRPDSSIHVIFEMNTTGRKHLPEMPRFAMRFTLPEGFEEVEYYGRGPGETTPDRTSSQHLGLWQNTVTGLHYSYIRPQFNGYHADTRWMSIRHVKEGHTLTVEAVGTPFGFTALHYSDEDLDPGLTRKMQHAIDLLPRRTTHVVIDNVQRGVGGDNSWGELPHTEYRHWEGAYRLEYILRFTPSKR